VLVGLGLIRLFSFAWRAYIFIEENCIGLGRPVTDSVSVLKTCRTHSKKTTYKRKPVPTRLRAEF
jgi:hypothetical protein